MSSASREINPVDSSFNGRTGVTVTMMDSGKRFNRDWIFRHVGHTFEMGKRYAITGPNGSGKSTLLQSIAGSIQLSEGAIEYHTADKELIPPENFYQSISIAAPYVELIEEMSAREFLVFHDRFKPLEASVSISEILSLIGLEKAADKQIRYYSSGMKQRVKLAQAIFSDVPVLLLDEPCTNLDASGYQLYHDLIEGFAGSKMVVVSSNDEKEMDFCTERLNITDYK